MGAEWIFILFAQLPFFKPKVGYVGAPSAGGVTVCGREAPSGGVKGYLLRKTVLRNCERQGGWKI